MIKSDSKQSISMLLKSVVRLLESASYNSPELSEQLNSIKTECRQAILTESLANVSGKIHKISKEIEEKSESNLINQRKMLVKTLGQFVNVPYGIINVEQKTKIGQVQSELKKGKNSCFDAIELCSNLLDSVSEGIEALSKRNYKSSLKKSPSQYAEGTETVHQSDIAIAMNRVSRDLGGLTTILREQYPDSQDLIDIEADIQIYQADGPTKFFESLDLISKITKAIRKSGSSRVANDKMYLDSLAHSMERMVDNLKSSQSIANNSSSSIDRAKNDISRLIKEIGNSGQGEKNLNVLKQKILTGMDKVGIAFDDFIEEQEQLNCCQQELIRRQQASLSDMSETLSTAQKNLLETSKDALTDQLCRISNRRGYESHAEVINVTWVENNYESNISLILLDIDYFKKVNDTYGHNAGDAVLKWFSIILDHFCKANQGCYLARYGGEEFVIVIEGMTKSKAHSFALKINNYMQGHPFIVKNKTLKIPLTVSVGIAFFESINDRMETVFKRADTALYKAKDTGRNRVVCNTIMKGITS